jgi:hypothetical protein
MDAKRLRELSSKWTLAAGGENRVTLTPISDTTVKVLVQDWSDSPMHVPRQSVVDAVLQGLKSDEPKVTFQLSSMQPTRDRPALRTAQMGEVPGEVANVMMRVPR